METDMPESMWEKIQRERKEGHPKYKGGKFNGKPNLNHFDSCTEAGYNMERDWKDEQGHSFTSADFS